MTSGKMIAAVAAAAVLFFLALTAWLRSPSPTSSARAQVAEQPAAGAQDAMLTRRAKGVLGAPVTIFELSDFQCPWCRKFTQETLPSLDAEYIETGKVRLIFINLPIASIHPNSPAAHEFAMCAAKQEKFWPVHDLLFRHQDAWADLDEPATYFGDLADSAGLSRPSLDGCLASGEVRPVVAADVNQARLGGVSSTPSFVIEGGILPGAQPMEVWRPILDSIVAAKSTN